MDYERDKRCEDGLRLGFHGYEEGSAGPDA